MPAAAKNIFLKIMKPMPIDIKKINANADADSPKKNFHSSDFPKTNFKKKLQFVMSWREYGALDKQGSEADSDSDAGRGQLKFCEIPIPMLIYPVKKKSDADSGADDG